jgi:hypothetical protein
MGSSIPNFITTLSDHILSRSLNPYRFKGGGRSDYMVLQAVYHDWQERGDSKIKKVVFWDVNAVWLLYEPTVQRTVTEILILVTLMM